MASPSVLHLIRRATYGPTPALLADVTTRGTAAWLERQLAPSTIDDGACSAVLRRFPGLGWSIPTVRSKLTFGSWDVMSQLTQATLTRAIWSERQLLEVMVEFWSNHLNVTNPSSEVWDSRAHYDRTVIRPHALGSFEAMLTAAAVHPAMLAYLDNASSTQRHPNENQGREMLELHTVGVGAYSEADVRDASRLLTGFSIDWSSGEMVYRPQWHHVGPLTVVGFRHGNPTPDAGPAAVRALCRQLAHHPATAARIARKLAVRFVHDDPPEALVDRLAATYLAADTQVKPVLRQLFASKEFKESAGVKVRRPYEDVVATVRVLGLRPDAKGVKGLQALHWITATVGQAPLAWPPPDGYPDVAPAWQSAAATLARWNAHLGIAARWWPGKDMLRGRGAADLLPSRLPATHGALIDHLARRLLQRRATGAERAALCTFLSNEYGRVTPSTPLTARSDLAGWRLPYVVALLLASPTHATR